MNDPQQARIGKKARSRSEVFAARYAECVLRAQDAEAKIAELEKENAALQGKIFVYEEAGRAEWLADTQAQIFQLQKALQKIVDDGNEESFAYGIAQQALATYPAPAEKP